MTRGELEHLIRAAADAVGLDELVIVGSQSILAQFPDAPSSMLRSMEADMYPRAAPDKAVAVDGALGEGSMFHDTFGIYAHGVGPETAKAPEGWRDRLVPVPVNDPAGRRLAVGLCLEVHDLLLSKCVAGRIRDIEFIESALRAGLADPGTLLSRVADLPVDARTRTRVAATIRGSVTKLERMS